MDPDYAVQRAAYSKRLVTEIISAPEEIPSRTAALRELEELFLPPNSLPLPAAEIPAAAIPALLEQRFVDTLLNGEEADRWDLSALESNLRAIHSDFLAEQLDGEKARSLKHEAGLQRHMAGSHARQAHYFRTSAAFLSDVEEISYELDAPGLKINFTTGPYRGSHHGATQLHDFDLRFNPEHYRWPLHLMRRTFGDLPLHYKREDLRMLADSTLLDDADHGGVGLQFYLKGLPDRPNRDENGPLLYVMRNTGKIRFWPAFNDNLLGHLSAAWSEFQGRKSESWNMGRWYAARDTELLTESRT